MRGFVVPVLHPDWTTPGILAMGFVHGMPGRDAGRDLPQADRDRIADDLIDLMLARAVRASGLMQTDPNFANYRSEPTRAHHPAGFRRHTGAGRSDCHPLLRSDGGGS